MADSEGRVSHYPVLHAAQLPHTTTTTTAPLAPRSPSFFITGNASCGNIKLPSVVCLVHNEAVDEVKLYMHSVLN